jgi:hypothetical protein
MPPPPLEHRYLIDGQSYLLREATMFDGQQRIQQYYALALTLQPGLLHPDTGQPLVYNEALWGAYRQALEATNGNALYAKAITQECLVEAPDFWWAAQPVAPGVNGTVRRVVTFKDVSLTVWQRHFQEVNTFLEAIFRAQAPVDAAASPARPDEPPVVAAAEALPPVLRGRAE